MPTGYTAGVVDGSVTTLREFALQCARGMGATIMMRDDPMDAPIPARFEPQTDYQDKRIAASRERLAELKAMTPEQRNAACAAYNETMRADNAKAIEDKTEKRRRYDAMIEQVEPWEGAPEGLKAFMLEQLRSSRDFDCEADPTRYMPKEQSVDEWYQDAMTKAERDIGYHEGERAKEISRTADRNAWLDQLYASLPQPQGNNNG